MSSLPASLNKVEIVADGQMSKPDPLPCLCHLGWVSRVSQLGNCERSLKVLKGTLVPEARAASVQPDRNDHRAVLSLGCHPHGHCHVWHLDVPIFRNTEVWWFLTVFVFIITTLCFR